MKIDAEFEMVPHLSDGAVDKRNEQSFIKILKERYRDNDLKRVYMQKEYVYSHCRPIFAGVNARVRKGKGIRKLLEKNRCSLKALMGTYDLETICNVSKELLSSGVFESTSKAQGQFPRLFPPFNVGEEDGESSDFEATRSESGAMAEAVSSGEDGASKADTLDAKNSSQGEHNPRPLPGSTEQVKSKELCLPSTDSSTPMISPATPALPNLYSISLPQKTQHHLFTMIQHILEGCCFNFGCRWLPDVLKARSCECLESVELTRWTRILSRHYEDLPPSATVDIPGSSFRDVLFATHEIRHTAVHRRLASTERIQKMIESALSLTIMLADNSGTRKMEAIRREVLKRLEELEQVQNDLGMKMAEKLARIGSTRAKLDELEKNIIQATLAEGNQTRLRLGSGLDKLLEGCRKSPYMDSGHAVETSGVEVDSGALKTEDCEGISHALPRMSVPNELFPDEIR